MTATNDQQAGEWQALGALLPPRRPSSPGSESERQDSTWTDEELAKGRLASIHWHIRRGWKYIEGLLVKGQVKAKPGFILPVLLPGDPKYNPRTDAPALRLHPGAVFVGPNRYRVGEHYVDQWGAFRDAEACPECGAGGAHEVRQVLVDPWPQAGWKQVWRQCRTCITAQERRENEARILASAPRQKAGAR